MRFGGIDWELEVGAMVVEISTPVNSLLFPRKMAEQKTQRRTSDVVGDQESFEI
jgi:hypothetical protein